MFAPPKLTVSSVFTKLKEIATMTGHAVSMILLAAWWLRVLNLLQPKWIPSKKSQRLNLHGEAIYPLMFLSPL